MVTGAEKSRQVAHMGIFQSAITMDHKQSRRILWNDRTQRNMGFRKIEVEVRKIGQETPLFYHSRNGRDITQRDASPIGIGQNCLPRLCVRPLNEGFWTFRVRQVSCHFR